MVIADSVMILPSRLKWFTQAFPFELKTTIFDFVVLTFNDQQLEKWRECLGILQTLRT